MPLLKIADVIRATCAIVARGALSGVRLARLMAEVVALEAYLEGDVGDDLGGVGRSFLGDDGDERLMFSVRGPLLGLSRSLPAMSAPCLSVVSRSIWSIARRTMSNAFRRSPV